MMPVRFSGPVLGIVGGSGLYHMSELSSQEPLSAETPFGVVDVIAGLLNGCRVIFLPRHGRDHRVPPHKVNYRANIWAMKRLGVSTVLAVNTVGGIAPSAAPGTIVVPDQIIDYTYGRQHTFADELSADFSHIDFTWPYTETVRQGVLGSLMSRSAQVIATAVYGATQGPRLETAAEVLRLKRDGCDIVGMTAMPEASLARELGLDYAAMCPVVNRAAGLAGEATISLEEIREILDAVLPCIRGTIADFAGTMVE